MILPDPASLNNALEALSQATVLCVGDVMLDRFNYGSVDRISPEAPIPVFLQKRELSMLGGAANTAANIVALDGKAILLGVTGDDNAGTELCALVQDRLGHTSQLVSESGRKTAVKQRFIANTQQLLRVDSESNTPLAPKTETTLLELFDRLLNQAQSIILSDYGKGVLSRNVLSHTILKARQSGKTILVDPKGRNYQPYAGAHIVTPNRKELFEATGMNVDGDDNIIAAARHVIKTCSIDCVLVTRGPEGLSVITQNDALHIPTHAREVWDVSGAGDTVIATMAAATAAGIDLHTSAQLANYTAGIVVGKVGTATASRAEIRAGLDDDDASLRVEHRIVTASSAAEITERWRAKDHKVGFTNGVFDLLHPGHVASLREAKRHCDKLIVGVNSDESVKRLKGPDRPVHDLETRTVMLAALEFVDLVVPFAEDTPRDLISAIKPDVLVKGEDYKDKEVVGADIVNTYGGQVVLAKIQQGFSTTSIIEKMRMGEKK